MKSTEYSEILLTQLSQLQKIPFINSKALASKDIVSSQFLLFSKSDFR